MRRLFDLIDHQQNQCPQNDALAKRDNDTWHLYSTSEVQQMTREVGAGLVQWGLEPEDCVVVISHNRPEWNFIDMGVQRAGGVVVPLYPNFSDEEFAHIVEQTGCRIAFTADRELYERVQAVESRALEAVYTFDEVDGLPHWTDILAKGEDRADDIQEDDLATIVYTSGTTGMPKGVMLTHRNLLDAVRGSMTVTPFTQAFRALSLMPLSHILERAAVYLYIAEGVSVYYARSPKTFVEDAQDVQPHVFTAVPRLIEKLYQQIHTRAEEQNILKRGIFKWALHLAKQKQETNQPPLYEMQMGLADKFVFRKWRQALGGQVAVIICGGAKLDAEISSVLDAAQIPIMEGYGLTETSSVITANQLDAQNSRPGTVGKPIGDHIEIKIGDENEILCRGARVMQGYYKMSEETDEVIDGEGWFHTEDVGEIDEDGFLTITGRLGNAFKTSVGEYVVPQRIENQFKDSRFIKHIVVLGEGRKMVTALIAPDMEQLRDWASQNAAEHNGNLLQSEIVRQHYEGIIEERNQALNDMERVVDFRLIEDDWSPESGELTPTHKPKRRILCDRYTEQIEAMYEES